MKIMKNYTPYYSIISKTRLFSGIPENHFDSVLNFLHASVRSYQKEELILRLGDPLLYSGIVLSGTVEGSFISENYNKINMNHFTPGRSFAEALACVHTKHSPVQLSALHDCEIMFLDLSAILSNESCECAYKHQLSINLIQILASQNVFSNLKLRIMSQKALRDRILIYLHNLIPDENGMVSVPFTQTALAEFLGVNRSALSRELGRMQDEGLILVDGKKMKLLLSNTD